MRAISRSTRLATFGITLLTLAAAACGSDGDSTDRGSYSAAGSSIDFTSTHDPERLFDGTLSANQVTANSQFGGIPFEIKLSR